MQDIGHQSLETHVLDTRDVLSALEVLAGTILASLPGIVDKIFGDLAKSTTFLAEVDDDTATTLLGLLDCFFNTESEVRTACADVRSEYVTSVAFVVDAESELCAGIGHLCWVTKDVDSHTANGRKEELDVVTGDELRIRATSLFEKCPAKSSLIFWVH